MLPELWWLAERMLAAGYHLAVQSSQMIGFVGKPLIALLLILSSLIAGERLSESERVQEWHKKHSWPPKWQKESEGLQKLYEFREKEIMAIPGADERWENWVQFVGARLVPNFTETGFQLVETPLHIRTRLEAALSVALEDWDSIRNESLISAVHTPENMRQKFVDVGQTARWVNNELLHMHEEWAGGVKLRPTSAYGIRLYVNGSALAMHYDRVNTHVISSIIHVGHEYDDDKEPWPIQIEDHNGNLHDVNLEPGQMLFYESAKCLHGRMKKFKGKYYAGIFVHYAPVDKNIWSYNIEDIIAAIPLHWNEGITQEKGARWSGAVLTVDSRVTANAPARDYDIVVPVEENEEEHAGSGDEL